MLAVLSQTQVTMPSQVQAATAILSLSPQQSYQVCLCGSVLPEDIVYSIEMSMAACAAHVVMSFHVRQF